MMILRTRNWHFTVIQLMLLLILFSACAVRAKRATELECQVYADYYRYSILQQRQQRVIEVTIFRNHESLSKDDVQQLGKVYRTDSGVFKKQGDVYYELASRANAPDELLDSYLKWNRDAVKLLAVGVHEGKIVEVLVVSANARIDSRPTLSHSLLPNVQLSDLNYEISGSVKGVALEQVKQLSITGTTNTLRIQVADDPPGMLLIDVTDLCSREYYAALLGYSANLNVDRLRVMMIIECQ